MRRAKMLRSSDAVRRCNKFESASCTTARSSDEQPEVISTMASSLRNKILGSRILPLLLLPVAAVVVHDASAQHYLRDFPNHAAEMKKVQPGNWQTPLVTTSAALCQSYRFEATRQIVPAGTSTWNVGNGRGFALILSNRMEFDTSVPNFAEHNDGKTADGFGDYSITGKTRLISGNADNGNYVVTAVVGQTFSTGLDKNGAIAPTRSYTLAGGKGFGPLNVQSAAGVTVPGSVGVPTIGYPVAWNSVIQDRVASKVWVELENNLTVYNSGTHNGKKQNFVTPGVIVSGLRPSSWGETNHKSFTVGAGMQIATTSYHANNHNLVLDFKMAF